MKAQVVEKTVEQELTALQFEVIRVIINKSRQYPSVSAKRLKTIVKETIPEATDEDLKVATAFVVKHMQKD